MTVPHSTGTPAEDVEELEFYTHRQDPVRFSACFSDDVRMPERAPLLARQVTLSKGWRVIQYRLPRSAHGGADAYGALEREVSAAVAVERRHGAEPYSELFTRLVGFHLDAPEPFVLYKAHTGRPIAARQGALTVAEQHKVLSQLALAVRLLEDVQLVHRDINPYTVRWDGTHVRLGELYRTQRVDEPREAFGAAPWAAPEQRDGTGTADPRDDLWSVARLMYFLLSGRPGDATAPPEDLADFRRLAALSESGSFAPLATMRAAPAELMRLLNVGDPLAVVSLAPDPLGRARAEFDARLAEKRDRLGLAAPVDQEQVYVELVDPPPRRSLRRLLGAGRPPAPRPAAEPRQDGPVDVPLPTRPPLCPHCLLPVHYDETQLFTLDSKKEPRKLDLSAEYRPMHRQDALRQAFQMCPHADENQPHRLPVPYLTSGEPLTVAMVGSSAAGKTHLLAAMLGEIEQGGLEPYGLKCLPLNPEEHREYLAETVHPLHRGEVLRRTGQVRFAEFADGLLVTGHGVTRPVVFFDLAGEDLAQNSDVTRFLMGVGAFIFVLDPLRALRLPQLDPVRERTGLVQRDLGDEAFATVLGRIPRTGPYITAPAAVALNKSDLVRFDPSVDRWLARGLPAVLDDATFRAESRDVHAFVRHHGSQAWLKPFDDCARCTLHFVAATGGQERGETFPHGVRPRRVLAPLLSVFAMCGLLPGAELRETGV
ncbi:hypothetical protein [Streptomyces sp. V1I6]|uniref:hypothetical protein n=1 Tax=Streptomyces sp. V1I6 TaxID=3042273 RepID=UPI002789FDB1|nr:hypothetical protein [Streptomyces sp. V1I6]MDQ0845770.1 hypothetical protein [Streptomyces sp. V1I6]